MMGCDCGSWEAWRNRMPGDDPDRGMMVRVTGSCECDRDGYEISLEPTNEGIVDDPSLIALRCVIKEPDIGPTVMTQQQVEWEEPTDEAVTRIRIDCGDQSSLAPIQEPQ